MKEKNQKDNAEKPITKYDVQTYSSIEQLPRFGKVIENSRQDAKKGKGISHEEMTEKLKIKYPFRK